MGKYSSIFVDKTSNEIFGDREDFKEVDRGKGVVPPFLINSYKMGITKVFFL